jgi:hypothetical protein
LATFYDGYLEDEPNESTANGIIIDGIFYGTINSKKYGKFHIESAKRYNHTLNAHSIIYNLKDINLSLARSKLSKRAAHLEHPNENDESHVEDDDSHLSCGSAKSKVKEWMKQEQEALYSERRRTEVIKFKIIIYKYFSSLLEFSLYFLLIYFLGL